MSHDLGAAIASLYKSGKYTDLVIQCGKQAWKVHRAVICTQSKPLAAAIDVSYGFKESQTGRIALEDDHPSTVNLMIEWLYTSEYDDNRGPTSFESSGGVGPSDDSEDWRPVPYHPAKWYRYDRALGVEVFRPEALEINAEVYVIAEKYDIQPLKSLARERYEEVFVSVHRKEFTTSFVHSLVILFDGTPEGDGLRSFAFRAAARNSADLLQNEAFSQLFMKRGEIAFDLFKSLAQSSGSLSVHDF
ncbi:hypothetical protein BP6252_00269 [Coleophoma cylindrospora]|uniref:BTB domain-containing protein n=1 Tax=Coleophoma cylindrospora TaxID=1849047 RepID=A0A3D8SPL3_9HELO|nr:hypothetical protein BP6252_00269 [Coleophoma cylindrospora]